MLVVKKNKHAFTYQNSENLMSCIYPKCLMAIKKALFLVSENTVILFNIQKPRRGTAELFLMGLKIEQLDSWTPRHG